MGRRAQAQEDPWAGFVDVLSNVVMVITFLVIILGIAMFALSQEVAKSMAIDLLEAEETRQELEELRREAEAAAARQASEASEGGYDVSADRPLLQPDEISGATDLTIRSHETDESDDLSLAATEEEVGDQEGVKVESSDYILRLTYQKGFYKLDEDTEASVLTFLEAKDLGETEKLELRAFATSEIGSISEARRVAFYRAMKIRTYLLDLGVAPDRLDVHIRDSDSVEHRNSVWLVRKPG